MLSPSDDLIALHLTATALTRGCTISAARRGLSLLCGALFLVIFDGFAGGGELCVPNIIAIFVLIIVT